ncbi:hypothetical protein [Nitriliruptor alkaliphilus]|uniref:hypothetical protein n=1 Tax=Nitriliruptor alkaliphilus TaxID=427918 RepID=UPI0012ED534F|nr:hypothetical protein [Nitriliruptor alkaliphilus]
MAVDERRRSGLYARLAETLGTEGADTMFELLPPDRDELATRTDLLVLRSEIDVFRTEVDGRFDQVDGRFAQVDGRFDQVDGRFDQLEQRLDDRFDGVRHELLAAFRGELVAAVSGQTRAIIVATAAATFGIGGLAVTLAQLL